METLYFTFFSLHFAHKTTLHKVNDGYRWGRSTDPTIEPLESGLGASADSAAVRSDLMRPRRRRRELMYAHKILAGEELWRR